MEKVKLFFIEKLTKFQKYVKEKMERFLKIFRDIKGDYLVRSPKSKWELVRKIGESILSLTGTQILDPNFKPHWYTYVPIALFCDFLASFCYTTWYYWNDPIRRYQSVSTMGVAFPVSDVILNLIQIKSQFLCVFFSVHFYSLFNKGCFEKKL